ncbi:MAG: hypothetical protein FWH26_06215 [Oscillospiraceae bacterium]|nr:hypothetical protein [Oscillospiraceae bacterium]
MMDARDALAELQRLMEAALKETGFSAKAEPMAENGKVVLRWTGESGALRLEFFDDRIALFFSADADALEDSFARLAVSLLELDRADQRDLRYVADDFGNELLVKCGGKKKKTGGAGAKKMPKGVSKSAVKNGDAYYDTLSFANSFTGIFPELRTAYKENYDKYGEFLCEEFFLEQGNEAVRGAIRRNNPAEMTRLFKLFNEVYENGLNDAQSLVAVTVLGSLENDEELLANCVDYMSADLAPVVINVNQYLGSAAGKRAKKKLAEPPPYKPKKDKKKTGFFQQLMSGGGGQGMPGM